MSKGGSASRASLGRRILVLVARRMCVIIPTLLVISLVVFALAAVAPFSPLDEYLGEGSGFTQAQQQSLAHTLGLDQSWPVAWIGWLGGLFNGNLGKSLSYSAPVAQVISERLPWTVILVCSAQILSVIVACLLGMVAGLRPKGRIAHVISNITVFLSAVPPFAIAMAGLLLFGVTWKVLPMGGINEPGQPLSVSGVIIHLILPTLVLTLSQVPWLLLGFIETVKRQVNTPFVQGAFSRGEPPLFIACRHVLPSSTVPFVALMAARFPELVVGTAIAESVFSWPGLGLALIQSAKTLDFALLVALTLILATLVLAANLLADVIAIIVDPRIEVDG